MPCAIVNLVTWSLVSSRGTGRIDVVLWLPFGWLLTWYCGYFSSGDCGVSSSWYAGIRDSLSTCRECCCVKALGKRDEVWTALEALRDESQLYLLLGSVL